MRNFRQDPEKEVLRRQLHLAKIRIQLIEEIADTAAAIKDGQEAILERLDGVLEAFKSMGDRLSALEQQAAESPVEAEIEPEKKETKKKK